RPVANEVELPTVQIVYKREYAVVRPRGATDEARQRLEIAVEINVPRAGDVGVLVRRHARYVPRSARELIEQMPDSPYSLRHDEGPKKQDTRESSAHLEIGSGEVDAAVHGMVQKGAEIGRANVCT